MDFPSLHINFFAEAFGNVKNNIIDFMRFAVVENDIFAGSGGIAEAVAQIKAEWLAVNNPVARSPVPGIVIGPNAPPPVQSAEVARWVKFVPFAAGNGWE